MAAGDDGRDALRQRILTAAFDLVPFDGWTENMLQAAARQAGGREADLQDLFPQGVRDLVLFGSLVGDERMAEQLRTLPLDTMRIRDRIRKAMEIRLFLLDDHRECVRRAAGFLGLPGNHLVGMRMIGHTVDVVWREIGDKATDFSFYTKRGILSAVYSSCLIYWLGDESEGYADTLAFLDRRIDDVMTFEKAKAKARDFAAKLPDPFALAAALRYPRKF